MIQVQKIRLTLTRGLPTTRVANRGVEVRHLPGRADIGPMIRGHLDDVRTLSTAMTVGHLLGVNTVAGPVTLNVITAAADPADVTVGERAARRRPGRVHVHQHAGAVHLPDGISERAEALGIGRVTLGGDETFCIV